MVDTGTDELSALKDRLSSSSERSNVGVFLLPLMIGLLVIIGLIWLSLRMSEDKSIRIQLAEFSPIELDESEHWKAWATENAIAAYLNAHDSIETIDAQQAELGGGQVDWIMSGGLSANGEDGKELLLRIELSSVDREDVSFAAEIPGVSESLNDMAVRAAGQVLAWSGHDLISSQPIRFAEDELPISRDALQLFSEGKSAFAAWDDRRAIAAFERALEISGDHPLIYLELSRSWNRLGYRPKALETLKRAHETRTVLSRRKQLEIEAEYFTLDHDWSAARDSWYSLKSFYPTELDYWLSLAEVNLSQSNVDQVASLLEEMRALPDPLGSDLRIDLLEGKYWYHKGDYAEGETVIAETISKARAMGERDILAEALLQMVSFIKVSGLEYLNEAEEIYRADANISKLATTLGHKAGIHRTAGRLNEAEATFLEAIELAESIGDEVTRSWQLNGLVIVYDLMGRQSESLAIKQELASYLKERQIQNRYGIMLENIGISNFKLGRLEAADASFRAALDVFHDVDDLIGIAWHPQHMSRVMSRKGDLALAREMAEDAFARSSDRPEGDLAGNSQYELAQIDLYEGRFAPALARLERIRPAFVAYENFITVAETDHLMARIKMRSGDLQAAYLDLAKAIEFFEADALPNYQLKSGITRVDLGFRLGSQSLADDCQRLQQLTEKSEYLEFTLKAESRILRCAVRFERLTLSAAQSRMADVREKALGANMFEAELDTAIQSAWIGRDLSDEDAENDARKRAFAIAAQYEVSLDGMLPEQGR